MFQKPVGTAERTDIVEPNALFFHHFVRLSSSKLSDIKCFIHHKMMNGMGTAEVEAKELEWKELPFIHHLRLLHHIARLHIAVIVHIGRDEMKTKHPQQIRENKYRHQRIYP